MVLISVINFFDRAYSVRLKKKKNNNNNNNNNNNKIIIFYCLDSG